MDENQVSEVISTERSSQIREDLEKANELYRATRFVSITARTGFHEKLVVITAGSLTLTATIATNVYIKPFTEQWVNHRVLDALAISSFFFFISLIASVIHNFVESEALLLDTSAEEVQVRRTSLKAVVEIIATKKISVQNLKLVKDVIRDDVDPPLAAAQTDKNKKAARFRTIERWIGIFAVIFFILGYLPAIGFVIYLARA